MRTRIAALLAAGVLALAGCGGDEDATDTGATDTGGAGTPTLQVSSTSVGDVLTDGDGMTIYLFTQDTEGTSTCEDECLEAWPPLEGEPEAGEGVDGSLIGTIERSDGTTQATYAGHPLYYFAEDQEPGDVAGQGVNDVWWVLDASGEPVETMPEESTPDGGGY
jgi:predicted lipoprotein with Yx(FWY)xxD motif